MKALILILAILPTLGHAVCNSVISRTNFSANSVLTSSALNSQFNTVYTRVNELPGDCITDATITTAKIQDDAITLDKLADAISERFIPVGTVLAFGSETAPDGYFNCDGSAISRTTYADLFAVIGTSFGEGDGSTTFNLPNFEGRFLRGWANGNANDPDRGSRTAMASGGATGDSVGSIQADAIRNITGTFAFTDDNDTSPASRVKFANGAFTAVDNGYNTGAFAAYSTSAGNDTVSFDASTQVATGGDNRPINAYVNFIIKY